MDNKAIVRPLKWHSDKGGYYFQPKAKPIRGSGSEKKVFQCLCGNMCAWAVNKDGTFRLIRVVKKDVSRNRRRSFHEFFYDNTTPHSENCDPIVSDGHSLRWLEDGRGVFHIVTVADNASIDEDGNVDVIDYNGYERFITVPASKLSLGKFPKDSDTD
jgi:hypothetical protein